MAKVFTLLLSNGLHYPYQIVHSQRAKYIRIKLSQQGDLSVTVPVFTLIKSAHEFVYSKRIWIEKNLAKVNRNERKLPETLDLKLLQELWKVSYVEIDDSMGCDIKLVEKNKEKQLELYGCHTQLNDSFMVSKTLNLWCKKKAKHIFNTMLQHLAEVHGFHYHRLSIRAQKTRWGSCSQQKNINLNCKLLFMPEEIVSYVMIHELCHTIEMNHSSRFWALVEDCDPQYQENRQRLKQLARELNI